MRRHLAPVTLAFALREIIERQFARLDSAAQHQRTVAVIRHDVIAVDHRDAERSEPFMTHPGNVEMTFALAIQVLLAQIAVPALEQDRKQTQFIFLAERGHCRANIELSSKTRQLLLGREVLLHVRLSVCRIVFNSNV